MTAGVVSVILTVTGLQAFGLSFFQDIQERNSDETFNVIGFEGNETYTRYPVVPILLLANTPQLVLSLLYVL